MDYQVVHSTDIRTYLFSDNVMTARFVKVRINLVYFIKEKINRVHAKTTEVYC